MSGTLLREVSAFFYANHRVLGAHECSEIHSHSYGITARFTTIDGVDAYGEVPIRPFQDSLQSYCSQYLNGSWILADEDPLDMNEEFVKFGLEPPKLVRIPFTPTFEGIARYLAEIVIPGLPLSGRAKLVWLELKADTMHLDSGSPRWSYDVVNWLAED